jgi:four helix bundle protein
MNRFEQKFDLEDRLIAFAVPVCDIAEKLPNKRTGNHVAGQLIRSGTSLAPNYGETRSAESRRDFIHKLKICLKEIRESSVWLKFINRMGLNTLDELQSTLKEADELISILFAGVRTAQKNATRG